MKLLILQHEADTPPGSTLEWLSLRHFDYEIQNSFELLNKKMNFDHYDGLIICGGSMNVDQENKIPWLKNLKSEIKNAIQKNKKIFGICLGSQLLAEALGAQVQRMPQAEIGWHKVTLTFPFQKNDLMAFHWHYYQFSLPLGAERLGYTPACPNQGFQFGKNILAYQFHPETTESWVNECLVGHTPKENQLYQQSAEEILKLNTYLEGLKQWYFTELDRFFVQK